MTLTISRYPSFAKQSFVSYLLLITFMSSFLQADEFKICGSSLKQALSADPQSVEVNQKSCPKIHTLIQWLKLRKNSVSFRAIADFLQKHPKWPSQHALRKKAEKILLEEKQPPQNLIHWFSKFPPVSVEGTEVYADALIATKKVDDAKKQLKKAWAHYDIDIFQEKKWLSKYASFLTKEDHFARANFLLNAERFDIKDFLTRVTSSQKEILETRLLLIKKSPIAQQKLNSISKTTLSDSGILYDHLKWLRQQDKNNEMLSLFKKIKQTPERFWPERFWKERNILTRRLMDEKRYKEAYILVKNHGLQSGEDYANAEWLAGWLALRFLHQPHLALSHFKNLHDKVKSPISIARAAYWAGQSYSALKQTTEAASWFQKAQAHPATYYGQLAIKQMSGSIPKILLKRPLISSSVQNRFNQNSLVQLINLLGKANASHAHMEPFLLAASESFNHPEEQALLIELAHKYAGNYASVLVAKKTTKSQSPLISAAYPALSSSYNSRLAKIDSAFVHAIIRQESRFKADAISSAGAIGLMQLMPETAKQTAQKFKLNLNRLTDPQTNLSIGSHHLKDLMEKFKGSMILAAAAYNAGSSAVEKWIQTYGDPRHGSVDTCDWIELIPYYETRNYVQRVMENYHCYK